MTDLEPAELIHCDEKEAEYSKISINKPEFVIGRSKNATFIILSLLVSKSQCLFKKRNEDWTICDKSSFGTYVNGTQLEKGIPVAISDGDCIELGPTGRFKYIFHIKGNTLPPPKKKTKLSGNESSEQTQEDESEGEHSGEKRIAKEKLLQEKRLLEDKVKEMQRLLQEKEKERIRDLELLQESKEAQVKAMAERLKKEAAEREIVKIQLTKEIQNLQNEKLKLESDIKGELCKKEGESAENLKRLTEELEKLKRVLTNVEGKKQHLEKELEETTKAKEDASVAFLKAKQEMLENFGELMETELQCSICNELFVIPIILNCNHTFCKHCIAQWKKKKKQCPVCRTKITAENRSIDMHNFIDKMVSNLSDELKKRRQEIVEERQVQELLGPKQEDETTAQSVRQRRGRQQNQISSSSSENTSQNNDVIVINSETSDSEANFSELSDFDEYVDDEDDDDYMEGMPGTYYGGYGYCYRCGRRGHWSRGCPEAI